ncbi:MAG: hypothetical protein IJX55_08460 [Clostridia bacterium]|nr:hypothetical protein [Clostridia bacterium]
MNERMKNGRAILKQALAEYELSFLEKYPPEDVNVEYSEEYKRDISLLIAKTRESAPKPKKTRKIFVRPLAYIAAALAIIISLSAAVYSVREPVAEFLIEVYKSIVSSFWNGDGEMPANGTSGSTNITTTAPNVPDIPEELLEKVRYDCGENGLYAVKEFYNDAGQLEFIYIDGIDASIGTWERDIIIENVLDDSGNITKSYIYDVSAPHKGERTVCYTLLPLENPKYNYEILNEQEKTQFYIKETEDVFGNVVKSELFDRNGRVKQAEEAEYYEDGTIKSRRSFYANGKLMSEAEYDENGNFIKCDFYEKEEYVSAKWSAKYHSAGEIAEYQAVAAYKDGGEGVPNVYKFDTDGKIVENGAAKYNYGGAGELKSISEYYTQYTFDEKGFLVKYDYTNNGGFSTEKHIVYTYNQQNLLTSVTTTEKAYNTSVSTTSVSYIYNDDGSTEVYYKNKIGRVNRQVFTDIYGRTIRDESYENGERTGYDTYTYDEYNNVIKKQEYSYEAINYEYLYEYDENGDLVKETKVWHTEGTSASEYTLYEYFDNGEVKHTVSYDYWGYKSKEREYYADGGYKVINYSGIEGAFHDSHTYDRYGNCIETVYMEGGVERRSVYEFFENGKEKKRFLYLDGVLEFGEEYNENGVVIKKYALNEAGKIVCTEYIKDENGTLVSEKIYENNVFVSYRFYKYFEMAPITPKPLKSISEYNTKGELIHYSEYMELKYILYGNPDTEYVLVKEETYENGEIVAYKYIEYEENTGNGKPVSHITKDGNKTSEAVYDEHGNILEEKFYENGMIVSLREICEWNSNQHFITLYDENGLAISKTLYYSNDDGAEIDRYELYEYYESGKLHFTKSYYPGYGDEYYLRYLYEYDESGYLAKEDQYTYNYEKLSRQYTYYYDAAGNKIRETFKSFHNDIASESDVYYTYDENGLLTDKSRYSGDILFGRESYKYHANGKVKEEYYYSFYNGDEKTYTERFTYYDEYGNTLRSYSAKIKVADKSIITSSEILYTYVDFNGEKLLLEKVTTSDGVVTERDKYQYHSNGQISIWERYARGELIEEIRYDEDGNRIFNW